MTIAKHQYKMLVGEQEFLVPFITQVKGHMGIIRKSRNFDGANQLFYIEEQAFGADSEVVEALDYLAAEDFALVLTTWLNTVDDADKAVLA